MTPIYVFLPLLAPLLLTGFAGLASSGLIRNQGKQSKLAELIMLFVIAIHVASAVVLIVDGPSTSALLGIAGVGLSVRLDVVSTVMGNLVSFVGWIVLRYSTTSMDREMRQGYFSTWMSLVLAAVLTLVMSANVVQLLGAWILTSIALNRLLLFFPNRAAAIRAAQKKAITSRLSEISLSLAVGCLIYAYGTTDIATILDHSNANLLTACAAVLIALSAVLASAQFPLHGWLTEVMEAPTPVSALLHAGIINAGGFLMIRFADVLLIAPGIMALLVMLGGFTALFGGLVMLTQPSVKTSLAWSTIAQMGFMVLQCGLALFSLALLHIVAHSLYKAHAFLSSGETVKLVTANKRPGPVAVPSWGNVLRAFAVAIIIYCLIGFAIGFDTKSVQAITLGMILVFGVAYLLAQGFADAAPAALTRRTAIYATATSISYFLLQSFAEFLTEGTLPSAPIPGPLEWALITLALMSFGAIAVAQATFPLWAAHPAAAGLRVHLTNGLYANALFDRFLGSWKKPSLHS
ncbi:MAG: proton-conducting transporter membrane subunit [Aestuariivita sp.]|nr:proton-conducting transporter membrane subunit [Aestuariivita sp.]